MINNRQAGRRRGRNNPRQNTGGGGNRGNGDSGNRIDSRARGNAAQLLEKYKNLARDAQMADDRVNVEYYLQFADHYFRVLADNRARQEEQQARFRRPDEGDQDDYLDEGDDGFGDPLDSLRFNPAPRVTGSYGQNERQQNDRGQNDRGQGHNDGARSDRGQNDRGQNDRGQNDRGQSERSQGERGNGNRRGNREALVHEQGARDAEVGYEAGGQDEPALSTGVPDDARQPVRDGAERPARTRRPRQPRPATEGDETGFDAALLPPAIARPAEAAADDAAPAEDTPAPRRVRRPRSTAQAAE